MLSVSFYFLFSHFLPFVPYLLYNVSPERTPLWTPFHLSTEMFHLGQAVIVFHSQQFSSNLCFLKMLIRLLTFLSGYFILISFSPFLNLNVLVMYIFDHTTVFCDIISKLCCYYPVVVTHSRKYLQIESLKFYERL